MSGQTPDATTPEAQAPAVTTPETPQVTTPESQTPAVETRDEAPEADVAGERPVDRVAMVSRRADGTPDQTPGYVVKGEQKDGE